VSEVKKDEVIAMHAVDRKNDQDGEIWDKDKNIERRQLVEPIPVIDCGQLIEVRPFRGKNEAQRES
jgi:hypothetical protein